MARRLLLVLLSAALALAVAACGGDGAGNGTDRAFVDEMIPHHQGAVEMAEIAQTKAQSQFVRELADAIIESQNAEIRTMRGFQKELEDVKAADLGMSMDMMGMEDLSGLQTAEPFDPAFLRMMIPHHETAIEMAQIELDKGDNGEIKKLAEQIIEDQKREIGEMKAQLQQTS
jgi:uncharacterized protein (DUF305 family)